MSNVFRLFISSTFSDFAEERRVLQKEVFPKIKEHCSKHKLVFQPIDLRWGVQEEAQLDQKTLELCLEEVRECKTHPYPNFLILSGDRYGWVPLPLFIEQKEYEEIYSHAEDKTLLDKWYKLDKNQIPASQRLQERSGEFIKYDVWEKEETKLRDIIQTAVELSNLTKERKEKYFTSATEAEVVEGILPYKHLTKYQEKLIDEGKINKKVDTDHIFGFYREIANPQDKSTFYTSEEDNQKAKEFRTYLQEHIQDENSLKANPTQKDSDTLETAYLEEFKEKITNFLISKIDEHIQQKEEKHSSPLEIEKEAQLAYKEDKLKDFLITDEITKTLDKIQTYINNKNGDSPFILHGCSGSGKSALLSKSIEDSEENLQQKIIYRYVGTTPDSSTTKGLIYSIFDELGGDIRIDDLSKQAETYEDFCTRVFAEIRSIKEDVAIFIDAIDQLSGDKRPIWLPQTLTSNVKIVISALKDDDYKEDTKVYEELKQRVKKDNIHQMPDFSHPKELLETLLKNESRKVTPKQMEYFLERYENAKTPFYILMASQEMKNWKSYQDEYDLATSNKEIVKEFIENLNILYHHHKDFIRKTLTYILSSKYGLSESEILTIFNHDKEFIEKMAPETFHTNVTHELPLIHWSRFYSALKPFLKTTQKDNENLLYFFHREFIDATKETYKDNNTLKTEHEKLLETLQVIIKDVQDKNFDENRWGKLYATSLVEYDLRYKIKDEEHTKAKEFAEFVAELENEEWQKKWFNYLDSNWAFNHKQNYIYKATSFGEIWKFASKYLYNQDEEKWANNYANALTSLAISYNNEIRTDDAIKLEEIALKIRKKLYLKNSNLEAYSYVEALGNLSLSYLRDNRNNEATETINKVLVIVEKLYFQDRDYWAESYEASLGILASCYSDANCVDKAISLEKKALEISEYYYSKNPDNWAKNYTNNLNNLANSYKNINDIEKAIKLLEKSLSIMEVYYLKNPRLWAKDYALHLNLLANLYKTQGTKSNEEIKAIFAKVNHIRKNHLGEITEIIGDKVSKPMLQEVAGWDSTDEVEKFAKSLSDEKEEQFTKEYIEHMMTSSNPMDFLADSEVGAEFLEILKNSHSGDSQYLRFLEDMLEAEDYDKPFQTLLYISKGVSIVQNNNEITLNSLLFSLSFVELNQKSKDVFAMIFDLSLQDFDSLPKRYESEEMIELARLSEDIPYDAAMESILSDLLEYFGNENICKLR